MLSSKGLVPRLLFILREGLFPRGDWTAGFPGKTRAVSVFRLRKLSGELNSFSSRDMNRKGGAGGQRL